MTGRGSTAHRVAFEEHWGVSLPRHLDVMHDCDNRGCVNIEHLSIGTRTENMQDCRVKGRYCRGEDHHRAVFTARRVLAIRAAYATGRYSQRYLARLYGAGQNTVRSILTGATWGDAR